jgi:hypothetical protein
MDHDLAHAIHSELDRFHLASDIRGRVIPGSESPSGLLRHLEQLIGEPAIGLLRVPLGAIPRLAKERML